MASYLEEKFSIDLYAEACKSRIVYLNTDVNDESASRVSMLLRCLNDKNHEPIWLYIDSPGGSVYAGLKIIDTIKQIQAPVFTVCDGIAMSMGAAILSCGDKRFITPHGTVMLHEVSSGAEGKMFEMKVQIAESDRLNNLLEEIISANCHKSKEEYHNFVSMLDRFMTPEDALKFGIVDGILKDVEKDWSESAEYVKAVEDRIIALPKTEKGDE